MIDEDDIYISHIMECIEKIRRYTIGGEDSLEEEIVYDAVLRQLQTMSESTQRLSEPAKNKFPEIPWKEISGFRNILVHDYLGDIDSDIVWNVIYDKLDELYDTMKELESCKV